MSIAITELELTDVNTISIPTDTILLLSLLIIFALVGYFFHNIIDNQTNQFDEIVDDSSNLELIKEKLEDQLILESKTMNSGKSEKPIIKKLNILPLTKLLRIGSLAIVAIGGSSLLGIQTIQNSYKSVKTSQVNLKTEDESAKSLLKIAKIKSSNQSKTKIKKISYADPLLSNKNNAKNNTFYQVKEIQKVDFFSF